MLSGAELAVLVADFAALKLILMILYVHLLLLIIVFLDVPTVHPL